jgi:hypothetical protein
VIDSYDYFHTIDHAPELRTGNASLRRAVAEMEQSFAMA